MKRITIIFALTLCTLFLSANLLAEDDRMFGDKGFFIDLSSSGAMGVSTFKSDAPSLQMNLGGGYRFNKWLSLQLDLGGGKLDINPQNCCSAHTGINNERNSYWCAFGDDLWHYFPVESADGWWYADMNGTTSYCKGAVQVNIDVLSFLTDKIGLDISPRAGAMYTRTELSGKSSLTGNNLSLKKDGQSHLLLGGESTLSYKFRNGLRLGLFGGVDILNGSHFDNIPEHVHKDNFIWDAGIKLVISLGKKHKKNTSASVTAHQGVTYEKSAASVVADTPAEEKVTENVGPATPAVSEPVTAIKEFAPVFFENNSAAVSDSQCGILESVAQYLKDNQELRILISGHASNSGTVQYNKILSEKRCNAVKLILEAKGVEGSRMDVEPCGIDLKAESAEKARRVDIIVETER